ncbi:MULTISPECIES: ABC transporter substrate-binding protein [unclassified Streptomyces]|uniref:ABC transporter substrate-binding protein n=1 Tax=unclassified Streptomyces TaxID=2593676 RepID=UPI002DD897EA|nr:sugar ABC transporter substrate-binding protein [Streptomyces sp. NBC_01257]WRZ66768.1 sugar ABC transporter substrate-binding protein [Streptomyces sp. NBC_01257]
MSRSWSRPIHALVGAVTAVAVLTACGGGGGGRSPARGTAEHPVTVSFWAWTKGSQEVVDAFNASHDTIKVKFEEIPSGGLGGYPKIANAVKAGIAPDLLSIEYPQLSAFVSQGSLQDISSYLTDDIKKKFLPQTIEMTTLGGKNWAVPFDASPQVFYYRKDFFTEHHIALPKTWDDFRTAAAQVKKASPKTRIATFFPDDPTFFQAMAWQAGAQWFRAGKDAWQVDTTDPASQRTAEYWQGLIDDKLVSTASSFSPEWTSSLKQGTTVGYLGASWGAGVLAGIVPEEKGKWAAMELPSWEADKPASGMIGGSTFAVSKNSTKTAAAVEFALWMSTHEDAIKARIGASTSSALPASPAMVPIARKAFDTSFYGGQDLYGLFTRAGASIGPDWIWGPSPGATNSALGDELGEVVGGSSTLPHAIRTAHDATVADLKKRGLKVEEPS